MKKAVVTIGVLAVVAGVGAGLLVLKQKSTGNLVPAAQLLPAETMLLAEVPDLSSSRLRLKETALWKIWHEPEVQAFLERPRSKIPKNATFDEITGHLHKAQLHRAFLAVTEITGNMPQLAAGVSFDGPREEIEALVAKAKAQAQSASPGGKSELTKYKDFEIESFSDDGVTVAGAFAGKWYFAANNVELLKSTLDRFSGASPGKPALDSTDFYKKSIAHLPLNPDFRFYALPATFFDRIIALSAAAGQPMDPQQEKELRKIQAIAASSRMEGERMHDSIFMLRPGSDEMASLSGSTRSLTSPDTLFYYAVAPVFPEKFQMPQSQAPDVTGIFGAMRAWGEKLTGQGMTPEDFKKAFGPEFGAISNWPAGVVQPTLAAAAQVRDPALARKFADTIFASWTRQESGAVTYWTMPAPGIVGGITPAAALTEHHFLVGLSLDAVQAAIAKAGAGVGGSGKTLEKVPAFEAALSTVPKPNDALVYIDSKALFERIYGQLRPMAMLWANFVPHAAEYVDVTKLPLTETISKHIQPTVFSSSHTAEGVLSESTGTVTLAQGGAVLGGVVGAISVPILQGKISIPGLNLPGSRSPQTAPVPTPRAPEPVQPSQSPQEPQTVPSPSVNPSEPISAAVHR